MKVVGVKVSGVEADDMPAAIQDAEDEQDWHRLFRDVKGVDTEYNEDTTSYLVDVVGDEEFNLSEWFDSVTNPLYLILKEIVDSERNPDRLAAALEAAKKRLRCFV